MCFIYQLGPRNSESSNEGSSHSDCALLHSPNSADVVNRFRRIREKVPAQRCGTRSRADVIGSAAGDDLFLCAKFSPAATASASPRSAVASSTQPLERYVVSGAGAPAVDGEYVPASFLVFSPVCESMDMRLASLPVIGTLLVYARAADPRVLLLRCATAGIDRGPAPWRAGMCAVLRTTACPRGSTAKACGCSAG